MDLRGKKILVVGLGKSGAAAAAFLKNRGAVVTATDAADEKDIGAAADEMRALGIALELGDHPPGSFESADLIILSPGVPHTIGPLLKAAEHGVPVIGEIELASRFINEPVVAVTGTNGKTTVTELLGEMLRLSGLQVFVGGNIGTPLISYVDSRERADVVVVEVSSFQLDTIATFRPNVGVILNITEDHLDRYPDLEAYARSKARLFENQTPEDIAIINGADPLVDAVCREISAKKLIFCSGKAACVGAVIGDDRIQVRLPETSAGTAGKNGREISLDLSRGTFRGRHNLENAGAAGLAALAAGGTVAGIQNALDSFKPPVHRLEFVDTIKGTDYYNDSKATNVNAVVRALENFTSPVVLIMGGRDKGSHFAALEERVRRHVKKLILLGEAAGAIASVLGQTVETETVSSMETAVTAAAEAVLPGETVLLSPGCASFDMFISYADRGEAFKKAVRQLK